MKIPFVALPFRFGTTLQAWLTSLACNCWPRPLVTRTLVFRLVLYVFSRTALNRSSFIFALSSSLLGSSWPSISSRACCLRVSILNYFRTSVSSCLKDSRSEFILQSNSSFMVARCFTFAFSFSAFMNMICFGIRSL